VGTSDIAFRELRSDAVFLDVVKPALDGDFCRRRSEVLPKAIMAAFGPEDEFQNSERLTSGQAGTCRDKNS